MSWTLPVQVALVEEKILLRNKSFFLGISRISNSDQLGSLGNNLAAEKQINKGVVYTTQFPSHLPVQRVLCSKMDDAFTTLKGKKLTHNDSNAILLFILFFCKLSTRLKSTRTNN